MVMKLSKVQMSPHFREIHQKLLLGESPRRISKWLKDEFDENIGYKAITSYRTKFIEVQTPVADTIAKAHDISETTDSITAVLANLADTYFKVAADFPENYEKMKEDPNVSAKELAEMNLKAGQALFNFFKNNQNNFTVNVNTGMESLFSLDDLNEVIQDADFEEKVDDD